MIAQASAASVRATFPGGHVDEMEPIDGIGVLLGPGLARAGRHGRVRDDRGAEAFDEHGGSSAPAPRTGGWIQTGAAPHAPAAAARGATRRPRRPAPRSSSSSAKYADHPGRAPGQHRRSDGMDQVFDELENGSSASRSSAPGRCSTTVFLTATKAAVLAATEIPNYANGGTGPKLGEVNFVDGRWKLSRGDVCGTSSSRRSTAPPVPHSKRAVQHGPAVVHDGHGGDRGRIVVSSTVQGAPPRVGGAEGPARPRRPRRPASRWRRPWLRKC